jgi:3-phenylpropionate/cinnamic acid dioxygenase small subunit
VSEQGARAFPGCDDLIDFVVREAELIDERRLDQWLALFDDAGHYWIPLSRDQDNARDHASLMFEDKLLLQARIERLAGDRTFSQQPQSRCQHVLQRPAVIGMDAAGGEFVLRTRYLYVEARAGDQHVFACTATHTLKLVDGALKILQKRVDLLDADAPLPMIQLFM